MILEAVKEPDITDPIWGLAKEESEASPKRFKLGAVISKRGRIVTSSHNKFKSHPHFGNDNDYRWLHAEAAAIYSAKCKGFNLEGATIIVYRKHGRNAKPCAHCQKLIKEAGIKKVIYSCS